MYYGHKKSHHYLPKIYLEGFINTEDSKIWTYDKLKPYDPWASSIDKTAFKNKLYHLEKSQHDINVIEDYFATKIEGPAAAPLKLLRKLQFPEEKAREILALFFSSLIIRTPGYLNHIEEQFSRFLNHELTILAMNKENFHEGYKKAGIEESYETIETDRLSILNRDTHLLLHKNKKLDIMVKMSFPIAIIFFNMHWALIKTNIEYPFITSDNPFFLNNLNIPLSSLYKPGLGMSGTSVYIPIASDLTLMMVNEKNFTDGQIFDIEHSRYDGEGNKINIPLLVEILNNNLALSCYQYIYYFKNCDKIKKLLKQS
ncbi:TPA: DUF4238 domain-containing protein [Legionella anisa]